MYLLQQALDLAVREFQDNVDLTTQSGGSSRSIQWNGLRYMLAEVRISNSVSSTNLIVPSRWLDIRQFLFFVFMDRDGIEVNKHTKKNEANIQTS